jgi:hypothetical protein
VNVPDTASNSNLAQLNKAVAENEPAFSEKEAEELLAGGFLITLQADLEKARAGPVTEWETPVVSIAATTPSVAPSKPAGFATVISAKEEEGQRRLQAEKAAQAAELSQKQAAALVRAQEEKKRLEQEEKRKQEQKQQEQEKERLKQQAEQAKQAELLKQKETTEKEAVALAEIKQRALLEEQQQTANQQKLMAEIKQKQQEEAVKAQQAIELAKAKAQEAQKQIEERKQQEAALLQQQLEEEKKREALKRQTALQDQAAYKKQLEQQKAEFLTSLGEFPLKRAPLLSQQEVLLKQKDQLLTAVSKLVNEEERLTQTRLTTESQEQLASDGGERHRLERERWQVEEKIRLKEKEKWLEEEKLEAMQNKLQKIDDSLAALIPEENSLKQKLAQVNWKLKEITLKEEKIRLEQDLAKLKQQAGLLQQEKDAIGQQQNHLSNELTKVASQEQQVEAKAKEIENQEKTASTPTEEQKIERNRWVIEEQRQKIEENRWTLEVQQKNVVQKMTAVQDKTNDLTAKMETLQNRLIEIDKELAAGDPTQAKPQPEPIKPKPPELKPQPRTELKPISKIELKPQPKPEPVKAAPPSPPAAVAVSEKKSAEQGLALRKEADEAKAEEKEKEQEAIKKAKELRDQEEEKKVVIEIRRQARQTEIQEKIDAIQARAQQVQREGELQRVKGPLAKETILKKLTSSSPQEEAQREEFLARVAGKEKPLDIKEKEQVKEVVFRPVVMKPSFWEKFLARFLIILIILVLAAAGILLSRTSLWSKWFGSKNNVNIVEPNEGGEANSIEENNNVGPEVNNLQATSTEAGAEISTSTSTENASSGESLLPIRTTPPSLIDYVTAKTISFSQASDIADRFRELLAEPEEPGTLVRLIIQDNMTNEPLSLAKTLEALGLRTSLDFESSLEPTENLMLYYSRYGARLAVLVPVLDKTVLETFMQGWEATLPQDSQDLLAFFAARPIKFSNVFKNAVKYSRSFRYLDADSPNKDLGLCYGFVSNYFIFTTSGSSMVELLRVIK